MPSHVGYACMIWWGMFGELVEAVRGTILEGKKTALKKIARYTGKEDMPHGLPKRTRIGLFGIKKDNKGSVVRVPIRSLSPSQPDVGPEDVKRHVKDPQLSRNNPKPLRQGEGDTKMPIVVHRDGKLHVADGHHRIVARHLRGKKHMRVRLHHDDD